MQTKGRDILGSRSNVQRPGGKKNLISLQNVMEFSSAGDWNLKKKKMYNKEEKNKWGSAHKKPCVLCQEVCIISKKSCVFFH